MQKSPQTDCESESESESECDVHWNGLLLCFHFPSIVGKCSSNDDVQRRISNSGPLLKEEDREKTGEEDPNPDLPFFFCPPLLKTNIERGEDADRVSQRERDLGLDRS